MDKHQWNKEPYFSDASPYIDRIRDLEVRVANLELENKELVGVNCYEHDRAEKAEAALAKLKIREGNAERMTTMMALKHNDMEDALARVKALPEKWRLEKQEGRMDYYEGYADAHQSLADELEATLKETEQ